MGKQANPNRRTAMRRIGLGLLTASALAAEGCALGLAAIDAASRENAATIRANAEIRAARIRAGGSREERISEARGRLERHREKRARGGYSEQTQIYQTFSYDHWEDLDGNKGPTLNNLGEFSGINTPMRPGEPKSFVLLEEGPTISRNYNISATVTGPEGRVEYQKHLQHDLSREHPTIDLVAEPEDAGKNYTLVWRVDGAKVAQTKFSVQEAQRTN